MKNAVALVTALGALFAVPPAEAAIPNLFGGSVTCTLQTGANAGERHCAGIFTTFDGSPIDVNVGFPPAPGSGPDGDFPIVGVFHGWGGSKISLTSGSLQQFLDNGYAVFSIRTPSLRTSSTKSPDTTPRTTSMTPPRRRRC